MNRKRYLGLSFHQGPGFQSLPSVLRREIPPSAQAARRNVAAATLPPVLKRKGLGASNFCSGSVHADE